MKNVTITFLAGIVCLLQVTSCSKDDNNNPDTPSTAIHLDSNAQVGRHIVDKDGNTLYIFANDANGMSNCTGGCLTVWKVFLADSASTTFDDDLTAADFSTITLTSGEKQTTYKGWPLYYYTPGGVQEAAGQTTGEGVGGIWFVAKINYSIMIANHQLAGADGVNYLSTYVPGDGRTIYFTDERGNTLYSFARDSALNNNFTAPDFSNNIVWPLYETDNITVPSTLDRAQFVVMNFQGRKQLTFKGWPLYYYGPDNMVRGSNKGIAIPPTLPAGTIWRYVNKDVIVAP